MIAKFVAITVFVALFLLSPNRSTARPSSTSTARETDTKEHDGGEAREEPPHEGGRLRERELFRDTFLRLNPNPRGETDEEVAHNQQANGVGGPQRHQRVNVEAAEAAEAGRPLRDGDTLLALTSADTLMDTAQVNNCRGDLFKHKVRMSGCRPLTIVNRFCHGSCASFYIPRLRSKKLKATFQSCAACVPTETDLVTVQLDCPGRAEGALNRTLVRVKRCACRNIALEGEEGREDEGDEEATNDRNRWTQTLEGTDGARQ
uniref:Bursicon n=1 Tax=Globodera rostochiensis TaxID=31243 RepID=A0A914HIP4_GLORO